MKTSKSAFSDLALSELTFGGAAISGEGGGYGFGDISEKEAIGLLQSAYELGVTTFDTAPIYGFGLSEERIGKAFAKIRGSIQIISKCGVSWHQNKRVNMTNDPKVSLTMLDESLKRMDCDYIDLYMVHWPDENVDIRKTLEVLEKEQAKGKIKSLGLCNTTLEELKLASEVCKIEVVQSELNILRRQNEEEVLPWLNKNEIQFMSWGTLDKGILTGRVSANRKFDKSDCRSWAPWWKSMDLAERLGKVAKIESTIKDSGHTLLEVALGYNLLLANISSVVCGAKNMKQLKSLVEALDNLPSSQLLNDCLKAVSE